MIARYARFRPFAAWAAVFAIGACLAAAAGSAPAQDGQVSAWLFALAIPTALLGVEASLVGWRQSALFRLFVARSPSAMSDVSYCLLGLSGGLEVLVALACLGLLTAANGWVQGGIGLLPLGDLPLWASLPAMWVIASFCDYWRHRGLHSRLFWKLHTVHHGATEFTMLNIARAHPLELAAIALAEVVPLAVAGFDPAHIAVLSVATSTYTTCLHSNWWQPWKLERFGIATPAGHRLHHGLAMEHHDRNFGQLTNAWDRLFGTYRAPDEATHRCPIGVDAAPGRHNTLNPFRELAVVTGDWLGELRALRPKHRFVVLAVALAGASLWTAATPRAEGADAAKATAVRSMAVEGTEIVVRLTDERVLRSRDLVGAILKVRFEGEPADVRIAAVEADPSDPSGSVWLHTFDARDSGGSWSNLCTPGPDGRRQGFPVQGADGALDFTCTSGAVGKCVRFGYRPWAKGPDGQSMAAQHTACVRLMRGDYGGTGQPWTRNGMSVDVYDPLAIQIPENVADQAFEAGWTADGAVCVHHVRVKENVTLAELEDKYPGLRGRTGAVCTEAFARALGAVVFNRSAP